MAAEEQVVALGHRFEMLKVAMALEVKDLGQQVEKMRQFTRDRLADSANALECRFEDVLADLQAVRETSYQRFTDIEHTLEQVRASTKQDVFEMSQNLEELVRLGQRPFYQLVESMHAATREDVGTLAQKVEAMRETRKGEVEELCRCVDSMQASNQVLFDDIGRQLAEMRTATDKVKVISEKPDVDLRLEDLRQSIRREVLTEGHRPILNFLENMNNTFRHEIGSIRQELHAFQDLLESEKRAKNGYTDVAALQSSHEATRRAQSQLHEHHSQLRREVEELRALLATIFHFVGGGTHRGPLAPPERDFSACKEQVRVAPRDLLLDAPMKVTTTAGVSRSSSAGGAAGSDGADMESTVAGGSSNAASSAARTPQVGAASPTTLLGQQ